MAPASSDDAVMNRARPHRRDLGFFLWMLPSFLFVFGFITGFSIGMPFLLAGVLLFGYLYRRGPEWPADLGLVAGLGCGLLLFWLLPTDFVQAPFIVAGFSLIVAGSLLYWYLRCRPAAS